MMFAFLLLFSPFLLSPVSAQYDVFTFNMSFLCGHSRQYTYDLTFNVRDENQNKSIKTMPIGKLQGNANAGITSVSLTGFYEADLSRSPVWEPIVEMRHSCVADPRIGYKKLVLQFAPSPALRNKTRYIYKYYMDITDQSGNRVIDAEITKDGPK